MPRSTSKQAIVSNGRKRIPILDVTYNISTHIRHNYFEYPETALKNKKNNYYQLIKKLKNKPKHANFANSLREKFKICVRDDNKYGAASVSTMTA